MLWRRGLGGARCRGCGTAKGLECLEYSGSKHPTPISKRRYRSINANCASKTALNRTVSTITFLLFQHPSVITDIYY